MADKPEVIERGRPTIFTTETAAEICRRLADGQSLREVCRSEGMPSEASVRAWALEDREGFSAQYARARELGYLSMADETVEIADDGRNDWIERQDGDSQGTYQVNGEHIQRSRLRVDTRKWLLSKVLPKVYGDNTVTEHTGKDGEPIEINMVEAARRIAFMFTRATKDPA